MIRFRETRGTSWRDSRQPGTRHWRSRSVSYGLFGWLLSVIGWVIIWSFIFVPWLALQIGLLAASAILAVVFMAIYHRGLSSVHVVRWGWFLLIDVDLGGR
jgi:hypothetical protein